MKPKLKVDVYRVVNEAVEHGVACGLFRADKHADDPLTEQQMERIKENVEREVMCALCEVIRFD